MDNVLKHYHRNQCLMVAAKKDQPICVQNAANLTPIRERTFSLIWQSPSPVGAYDLLDQLAAEGFNSAPPTVYRALNFLQEQGLIHKISSRNTYMGCRYLDQPHEGHFVLCDDCNQVLEIDFHAKQYSFAIKDQPIEITSLYQHRQASAGTLGSAA